MSAPDVESPPAAQTGGRATAVGASAKSDHNSAQPGIRQVRFRALTGREWAYSGKRGRVLRMLASGRSITQWDTLPWHTRLGGSIHAMRGDGLAIETVREGEFRHARYTLLTPGLLVEREQ